MGFEQCHPAVNLIFFAAVLGGTLLLRHPVFLVISFTCAFAYSVKRNGRRAVVLGLCLLPAIVLIALYYSSFHHFGVTVFRQNFIGNRITVESLLYGFALGSALADGIMWMSCLFSVFSTDKVVYLFGAVSPHLSLLLAILLRLVPRLGQQVRRINSARKGLGRGVGQGNPLQRLRNSLCMFSILITWLIETAALSADSMRSRGCTLRGRTAFSIYRFDNRDRLFVIGLFACLTAVAMGILLGQTAIRYDPVLYMTPVTPLSLLFYTGYGALCLMPLGLELWTQYCFAHAQRRLSIEK